MPIHEALVRKIQKLLALAASPNENEAAAAAEKAQQLILRFNVDLAALDVNDPENQEPMAKFYLYRSKTRSNWRDQLALGIAATHFCQVYFQHGRGLVIVGREPNVRAAQLLLGYLEETVARLAKAALRQFQERDPGHWFQPKTYSMQWKIGCAMRLRERIEARYQQAKAAGLAAEHAAPAVTALAVIAVEEREQEAIQTFLTEEGVKLKKSAALRYRPGNIGFRHGRDAAEGIGIEPQVTAGARRQELAA